MLLIYFSVQKVKNVLFLTGPVNNVHALATACRKHK